MFSSRNCLVVLILAISMLFAGNVFAASGTFSATGSMGAVRAYATATLLNDGKVLIVGGWTGSSNLASAELYDPSTGIFTPTGSMTNARHDHRATLLPNGKVLISGGWNGAPMNSAELYDPSTGTFSVTGNMNSVRSAPAAVLLQNGKVLIAGGVNHTTDNIPLASAELYDPSTGTFTPTGSMITARGGITATLLPNGKVLFAAGYDGKPSGTVTFNSAELYDPSTGTFSSTGNMNSARYGHVATLLSNGTVLLAGGYHYASGTTYSSAEIYNPSTGTFTLTGSMNSARGGQVSILLPNGRVLVAGGSNWSASVFGTAELYDLNTGSFTSTGSMSVVRFAPAAALLPNGLALVAGGLNGGSTCYSSAELFNSIPMIQLPKTGQTKCYDSAGVELASCTGTGQDGEYQAGVAWPNPRFTNPDGSTPISGNIIRDALTGLEWAKDAGSPTVPGSPTCTGGARTWTAALDYVACLNTNNYLGHNDWYLPNINELESLINAEQSNPSAWLAAQEFANYQIGDYWSSTTYVGSSNVARVVNFVSDSMSGGIVMATSKASNSYTLPVRMGQGGSTPVWRTGQVASVYANDDGALQKGTGWPSQRFTDNLNGMITDNLTGLLWTKDANAPGPAACSPASMMTWQGALDYVACLNSNNYLGQRDWRLPNRKELQSLMDNSNYKPSLPSGHLFQNVKTDINNFYWSGDTVAYAIHSGNAWIGRMDNGGIGYDLKTRPNYVWPVRGEIVTDLVTGLVAYYPFNGNANDESGNGNNGTVNGATLTSDRFGNASSAYSFDGASDIVAADSASLNPPTTMATTLWFKAIGSVPNYSIHYLLQKNSYVAGEDYPGYYLRWDRNSSVCPAEGYLFENSIDVQNVRRTVTPCITFGELSQWNFVSSVYDGTAVSLYLNGTFMGSTPITGPIVQSVTNLFIGSAGVANSYFNGIIDDIRIYNRALSSTEVAALYSAEAPPVTLTVTKSGTGSGTVTADSGTINWTGNVGTGSYTSGAVVTLTATPDTGSTFTGWSGDADCSDGIVTMSTAVICTATFNLNTYALNITKSGTGSGTITSTPAGIDCGADCTENYNYNAVVTLSAIPDPGSVFAGWTGDADCSDGVVTMSTAVNCTATFNTATLNDGLIAYYPFNGNANDESGNGNNGTVNGATLTTDKLANTNRAYNFNGGSDISLGNLGAINDYSVSLWFKKSVGSGYPSSGEAYMFGTQNITSIYQLFKFGFHSGWQDQVIVGMHTTMTDGRWYLTQAITNTNWHHIVVSRTGTALNVFIDGTQQTLTAHSVDGNPLGPIITGNTTKIGANGGEPNTGFSGLLDDVRIYNRALTVTEVEKLYIGGTVLLPKTGQTKCYDSAGLELASCTGTGQDGEIQAGISWPNPRFTNPDGSTPVSGNIILDKLTGLEWAKDAGTPTVSGTPTCTGGAKTWQGALDYVACLNTNNYLGHNDWYLPNINELESVTNADQSNPSAWLNIQGFSNFLIGDYWSSSTYKNSTSIAWHVGMVSDSMSAGIVSASSKGSSGNVWPVRTGKNGTAPLWKTGQTTSYYANDDGALKHGVAWPTTRFQENGDGTITDALTGIIWTKDAYAPGPPTCNPASMKTWTEAFGYVNCLNSSEYLGHKDWRLPNKKELLSLMDFSQFGPSLLAGHPFTTVRTDINNFYWSGSTVAYGPHSGNAWIGRMDNGGIGYDIKTRANFVWPVRGGTVASQLAVSYDLNITKSGTGFGYVSSTPAGIDCGATCSASYANGTIVTLTATPDTGSAFTGWSGDADCSDGIVTMSTAVNCTATFDLSDTTAPETTIDSYPAAATNLDSATFTFSSSEAGSTFECSIDSGTWAICTSPAIYMPLSEGSHTFEVRAIDTASNTDTTPATYTWTIDTTAPTLSIGSPSASLTKSGPITYTVTYTGADAVTLANANVTLNKTGTANGTAAVSGTGTATRTVTISGITGDGTIGISIAAGTASDTAGNTAAASSASATFSVDNTVPVVSAGADQTRSAVFTQTATATDASSMTYAWTKQSGTGTITFGSATALSTTISVSASGTYVIRFTATDSAGNSAYDDMTLTYAIDSVDPTVVISSPTDRSTRSKITSIYGTATDTAPSSGIDYVEVQVSYFDEADGVTYYLQPASPSLLYPWDVTEQWLRASTTTSWASWNINTSYAPWYADTWFKIIAKAVDKSGNSATITHNSYIYSGAAVATDLTLATSSQSILMDETIDVSGKLTRLPDIGVDLSGLTIQINITDPDGIALTPVTTTTYDAEGHYIKTGITGFTKAGVYSVKADFAGNAYLAKSSSTEENIIVGASAGYAIIVEGKVDSDEGRSEHNKTTNKVYRALKDRGFLDNDIYYINYQGTGQPTGIVVDDATPTKADVKNAIQTWARTKLTAMPAPLYIVMVDHGSLETFWMNTETISPSELNTWLDNLEAGLSTEALAHERVIIIGTCYSGSFMPYLAKTGRIIITSSAADEKSYRGPEENDGLRSGEFFIDELFKHLEKGYSLKKSFEEAAEQTEIVTKRGGNSPHSPKYQDDAKQHPLIEDDGLVPYGSNVLSDGSGDGVLSDTIYLGIGETNDIGSPAEFVAVSPTKFLTPSQKSATFWGEVSDSSFVASAWIEIRSLADELIDQTTGTGQLVLNTVKVPMAKNAVTGKLEATYSNFVDSGMYEIYYFTQQTGSLELTPMKRSVVYKNKTGNYAPAAFDLVSPADVTEQETVLMLDWGDSTDPDGLTYTVEVTRDPTFVTKDFVREEIISSSTVLGPEAKLDDLTIYYWRVYAIDKYGAKRKSTSTRSFKTNNTNGLPAFISGYVTDLETGNGLGGVTITSSKGGSTQTFSDGYFILAITPNTMTITAKKTGYTDAMSESFSLASADSVIKNFSLVTSAAPDTVIGSKPSNPTKALTATFAFTSTKSYSTFECMLDGSAWAACASPKNYTGLAAGSHTFKVRATDYAGTTDLTPAAHTWIVDVTVPSVVSVTPTPMTTEQGKAQTFTAVYSDADGFGNIKTAEMLVNSTLSIIDAVRVSYDQPTNKLSLYDDPGTNAVGTCAPGAAGVTISNSKGTLNCQQTTVAKAGNSLTVKWNITPKAAFASTTVKKLALRVTDKAGNAVAWTQKGSWTITAANTSPVVGAVSHTPATTAAGAAHAVSAAYTDAEGYANIRSAELLVTSAATGGANSIWAKYDLPANELSLYNDAGTGLQATTCAPGEAATISNTQGTLNCATTTVAKSLNKLTVNWNITPKAAYTGAKNLKSKVTDNSGAAAGPVKKGTWTITAAAPSGESGTVTYGVITYGLAGGMPYAELSDQVTTKETLTGEIEISAEPTDAAGTGSLKLALRKAGYSMAAGSIRGTYSMAGHSGTVTTLSEYTFDGSGRVTMAEKKASDNSSGTTVISSYEVSPDGSIAIGALKGQVTEDGQVIVLASDDPPALLIGALKGSLSEPEGIYEGAEVIAIGSEQEIREVSTDGAVIGGMVSGDGSVVFLVDSEKTDAADATGIRVLIRRR